MIEKQLRRDHLRVARRYADEVGGCADAMQAGGVCVIANGNTTNILDSHCGGESVGTSFMSTSRMAGKRRWITYAPVFAAE